MFLIAFSVEKELMDTITYKEDFVNVTNEKFSDCVRVKWCHSERGASAPSHIRPGDICKLLDGGRFRIHPKLIQLTSLLASSKKITKNTTMADTAAPAPAKKATKAKKSTKAPAAHPTYIAMITAAVGALKDRKGSSAIAIKKYIVANYKVDEKSCRPHLVMAIKKGVASGALKQVKGTGATGSFKLAEKEKKAAKPKVAKAKKSPAKAKKPAKKATKSPKKAAKKTATKKTATKKTPKKSTKKAAKPAAKKPVAKKAKKPAAKKAAPKK